MFPLLLLAQRTETSLAMLVENMPSDQIAESASYNDIGGEVLQASESRDGNSGSGSVSEPLYPRLWVFVRDCARSRPGDDRMTGGKRIIQAAGLEEISSARSLQRTLTLGDQLQRRVHHTAVGHSLGSQHASFESTRIASGFSIQE